MECWGEALPEVEQPQCVSRWKLNFRGRKRALNNKAAAAPTIAKDTNCCQSMLAR
jgi:hypothetical protein